MTALIGTHPLVAFVNIFLFFLIFQLEDANSISLHEFINIWHYFRRLTKKWAHFLFFHLLLRLLLYIYSLHFLSFLRGKHSRLVQTTFHFHFYTINTAAVFFWIIQPDISHQSLFFTSLFYHLISICSTLFRIHFIPDVWRGHGVYIHHHISLVGFINLSNWDRNYDLPIFLMFLCTQKRATKLALNIATTNAAF